MLEVKCFLESFDPRRGVLRLICCSSNTTKPTPEEEEPIKLTYCKHVFMTTLIHQWILMMCALKVLCSKLLPVSVLLFQMCFAPNPLNFTAKRKPGWIPSTQAFFRCVHSGSANITGTFFGEGWSFVHVGDNKRAGAPIALWFLQDKVTVKMMLRTAAALILALSGILNC